MPTEEMTAEPMAAPRLTDEQVQSFRENGFLNYGRVLTDEQLSALRKSLDRVLSGRSGASPEAISNIGGGANSVVTQVVNVWEAEPAFREHLSNPVIVPLVAQLMGTDTVRVWHDQMQLKPAAHRRPDHLAPGPPLLAGDPARRPGERLGRPGRRDGGERRDEHGAAQPQMGRLRRRRHDRD